MINKLENKKSLLLVITLLILSSFVISCCGHHHRHKKKHKQDTVYIENSIYTESEEESEELPMGIKPIEVKVALPLNYISITSEYGSREDPVTGKQSNHNGLDLSASSDTAVAMMPGVVADVGKNNIAGNFVVLRHEKLTITYCHLSKVLARKGNTVVAGSMVGITGATGRTTGEHLHLTCKYGDSYIDPELILDIIKSQMSDTERSSDGDSWW